MTFVHFDDGFPDHSKVAGLTDAAFRLWVAGIAYCARGLTDGVIQADDVPRLVRRYKRASVPELVSTGLWTPAFDTYVVHDYLQWNPSRATVLDRKERAAKRKAEWQRKNAK